jgi:copper chaperone CopZ
MTLRLLTAIALACLVVFPGSEVAAEEPGESRSDHAAEAHHRHLVSAFVGMTHEHGHPWWAWASAVVLGALFVYFVLDDLRGLLARRRAEASSAAVTLEIEGLTCNNCVRKLERALREADGVTSATVTLAPSQATIEGNIAPTELEAVVCAAGYGVK